MWFFQTYKINQEIDILRFPSYRAFCFQLTNWICRNFFDKITFLILATAWIWGPPRIDGRCGPQYNADCSNAKAVPNWSIGITPCCRMADGWCGKEKSHCSSYDFRGILQLPHDFLGKYSSCTKCFPSIRIYTWSPVIVPRVVVHWGVYSRSIFCRKSFFSK